MSEFEFSDRLKQVLACVNQNDATLALFPFLKDWPTDELVTLLNDVNNYHTFAQHEIQQGWEETAAILTSEFNNANRNELDAVRDGLKLSICGLCSEICSVVIFYLTERGVVVE